MVQHVIDERRWQAGMREYIEANLYGNTDGRVYFSHMQHAINTVPPYQVGLRGPKFPRVKVYGVKNEMTVRFIDIPSKIASLDRLLRPHYQ